MSPWSSTNESNLRSTHPVVIDGDTTDNMYQYRTDYNNYSMFFRPSNGISIE